MTTTIRGSEHFVGLRVRDGSALEVRPRNPDDCVVDKSNRVAIFANIIEREDNYHVYLLGNRGSSSSTSSLVYNKATFDGRNWSWGIANLGV